MGNNISSTTASIATAGITSYVSELGDIQYGESLSSARFMKTIRGRHKDGAVVVKIFIKPEPGISLANIVRALEEEREALLEVPNAFPYQRIIETEKAGYLIRQYFFSSLYDRISTRPFLNLTEKKWITYQLLCGVHDAHMHGIYHGDIKTENVLVTSWNWVYLADFSGSIKPTYLPEDNPADFSFFFDNSSRRTCYLAPERFYKPGIGVDKIKCEPEVGGKEGSITSAMDIFSLGCVIAELFLEGTPIFSLSQLFKYRTGEYDPGVYLDKIEDPDIKAMVKHMINIDPTKRFTAEQYLHEWRGTAFPIYFSTFLHQYVASVTDHHNRSHDIGVALPTNAPRTRESSEVQNTIINTDADDKIERIYNEFDKIAFFLGFFNGNGAEEDDGSMEEDIKGRNGKVGERSKKLAPESSVLLNNATALSVHLNIPNYDTSLVSSRKKTKEKADDGALIFLSLICAKIRNTAYPSSRLHALDMLLAIGQHLEDEFKLDRLLPYLIALLGDEVGLLLMVEKITPHNATIFPEYILPNVVKFASDPEVVVRVTYAQCIASIAESALRFLEMTQAFKSDGSLTISGRTTDYGAFEGTYDSNLHDLQSVIQEQVTILLIDPESAVKRALLANITSLCIFFGRQKANDVLLSHMITYLNDRDWMLRCTFFESIIGVGTFVGGRSLEEYILPLMIQALTDAEEFVVEKVLNSLTSLAELGLFHKMKLWELVGIISSLLCHPSIWIRYGAIAFISSAAKLLPTTDVWCIVYPIIRPFLQADIAEVTELQLLENVKEPLSRAVFGAALTWASKANKSLFWKQSKERKVSKSNLSNSASSITAIAMLARRTSTLAINNEKIAKSEEDEHYLKKLRNIGMTDEDEEKLAAMRDYIYKLSVSKSARPKTQNEDVVNIEQDGSVKLKNIGITIHNVFLRPANLDNMTNGATDRAIPTSPYRIPSAANSKTSLTETTAQYKPVSLSYNPRGGSDVTATNFANSRNRRISMGQVEGKSNTSARDGHNNNSSTSLVSVPVLSTVPPSPPERNKTGTAAIDINIRRNSSTSSLAKRMSLVGRAAESPKAAPATSTSMTTVEGTMEIPVIKKVEQEANPVNNANIGGVDVPRRNLSTLVSSTYEGNDRNVKNLLDSRYLKTFPNPMPEFGPRITKSPTNRHGRANVSKTVTDFRPEGTLIAHLTEHKAAINKICVSPDHKFFASCSDDGTVRIWDCARLEKNVTNRSRATYVLGGKVKCMTFIDSTHSIACASDNGNIHVFRVEYTPGNNSAKYGKLQIVREKYLKDEYAISMEHYNTGTESILMYATTKGTICGLDLRSMQLSWSVENPRSHGVITAMVTDRAHNWLLVGSSRGILTLWDLRFRIALRSWMHPTKSKISKLLLCAHNKEPRVIIAAGKHEVSLWDIEKVECRQMFAVRSGDEKMGGVSLDTFKPIDPPGPGDILMSAFTAQESSYAVDNSIRAVLYMPEAGCSYMLTAGSDRKIRFWDIATPENSYIVTGQDADEAKPTYSTKPVNGLIVHYESSPHHSRAIGSSANSAVGRDGSLSNNRRSSSKSSANARNSIIILQQQSLLRNHLDCITDIAITEIPYPMLISGDREGIIKVFA